MGAESDQAERPATRESVEHEQNRNALGQHLAAVREDRGLSLRRVGGSTNKLVSNAYHSQIEKGKV